MNESRSIEDRRVEGFSINNFDSLNFEFNTSILFTNVTSDNFNSQSFLSTLESTMTTNSDEQLNLLLDSFLKHWIHLMFCKTQLQKIDSTILAYHLMTKMFN